MPGPPDQDRTAAGIIVDPRTLERVVPQSRRKDGSVRKELKIRPGFTPQEDVGRFRSSRQLASSSSGPRLIPGSNRAAPPPKTGEPPNPFASDPAGKTRAAAKNEKRKEKRRAAAGADGAGVGTDKAWDESSDEEDGGLKEAFAAQEHNFPALGDGGKTKTAAVAPSASTATTATNAASLKESPVMKAFREDSGQGLDIPDGTEADLTARITSPPAAADVPETAAARQKPSDGAWRSAKVAIQSATSNPPPRTGPSARGRGRGIPGGPGPTIGSEGAGRGTRPPAEPSKPTADEPRVRKEVRVRGGGPNDVSSLAARVRGLVLENQTSRSGTRKADEKPDAQA